MIWVDFRLAKTWNNRLGFLDYLPGRSLIMETLAVMAAQRKADIIIQKAHTKQKKSSGTDTNEINCPERFLVSVWQ